MDLYTNKTYVAGLHALDNTLLATFPADTDCLNIQQLHNP